MPQELLNFPPAYCIVGVYRLVNDPKIRGPIMVHLAGAIKKGAMIAAVWSVIAYPWTRFYVRFFMNSTSLFSYSEDATFFRVPVQTYASLLLVLGQAGFLIQFFLSRTLGKAREEAYHSTVASRGKDASFWGPYIEEWALPPVRRAEHAKQKISFYTKLSGPLVRYGLKFALIPLNFIPFLGLVIGAGIKSLTLGKILHEPFFKAKGMSDFQRELFVVERQTEYRTFGFVAALLERVPVLGIVFGVSNRIGAAMWAHDLEKRQHAYACGELKPEKRYESKMEKITSDLPDGASGSFPRKKME
ncbi:hypothetical protein BT69DRAFT_1354129 [Atractiella rhizophila]|nr:hypothetical protein BT69DRAFT_1354129 [Atractiella rhizophila]